MLFYIDFDRNMYYDMMIIMLIQQINILKIKVLHHIDVQTRLQLTKSEQPC